MPDEYIFRDTLENPEKITIESTYISPTSTEIQLQRYLPRGIDDSSSTCYGNVQKNSRNGNTLPGEMWRVYLKKEIYSDFNPIHLLKMDSIFYIRGNMLWMLLDNQGNEIITGMGGSGTYTYTLPGNKNFVHEEPNGVIAVHAFKTGDTLNSFKAKFGSAIKHSFFFTFGSKLLFTGSQLPMPGVPLQREDFFSILEISELPQDNKDTIDSLLEDIPPPNPDPVLFNTPDLLTVGYEDNVIIAEENRILFFDTSLQVVNLIKGEFKPITMSVDEACRMHLIVSVEGKYELWIVNREGGRECTIPLFKPFDKTEIPPIIGFDHTVYLIAEKRIMAARQNGEILYVLPVKNSIKGAIITQDDKLLVTEEREVAYFSIEGERNKLFAVEDETICTPPVLSQDGKISFTTDKNLYSIEAEN